MRPLLLPLCCPTARYLRDIFMYAIVSVAFRLLTVGQQSVTKQP